MVCSIMENGDRLRYEAALEVEGEERGEKEAGLRRLERSYIYSQSEREK